MAQVDKAQGILTEQQFNQSPFKTIMSYADYVKNALRLGSAFTFARALKMQHVEDTSDRIKDSIRGWYVEKEAKKDEAEERYYAALAQYKAMRSSEDKAYKELEYKMNSFGENSIQYNDALKKYKLSAKTSFDADVNLSCARDQFNFANTSAFKAYLTTRTLSS